MGLWTQVKADNQTLVLGVSEAKQRSGRSSVRPWKATSDRPQEDSGKPSGDLGGKECFTNSVYSEGEVQLTVTGGCRQVVKVL